MKTLWKLTKEATRYKGLYVLSVLATFGLTIEKVRSSNEELMMSYIKRKDTISIWYKLRIQQISDYIVKCKKTACNCCKSPPTMALKALSLIAARYSPGNRRTSRRRRSHPCPSALTLPAFGFGRMKRTATGRNPSASPRA